MQTSHGDALGDLRPKARPQKAMDEFECLLLNKLDEEYTQHPFYGIRGA